VILPRFYDLVVCGVKNENHGIGKVGGLNLLKCLQSDMEKVWEQQKLIFLLLVHSQVL